MALELPTGAEELSEPQGGVKTIIGQIREPNKTKGLPLYVEEGTYGHQMHFVTDEVQLFNEDGEEIESKAGKWENWYGLGKGFSKGKVYSNSVGGVFIDHLEKALGHKIDYDEIAGMYWRLEEKLVDFGEVGVAPGYYPVEIAKKLSKITVPSSNGASPQDDDDDDDDDDNGEDTETLGWPTLQVRAALGLMENKTDKKFRSEFAKSSLKREDIADDVVEGDFQKAVIEAKYAHKDDDGQYVVDKLPGDDDDD